MVNQSNWYYWIIGYILFIGGLLTYVIISSPSNPSVHQDNIPLQQVRLTPQPIGTPNSGPGPLTITANPDPNGPDLFVSWARLQIENGTNCTSGIGVGVSIGNMGFQNAGAFTVYMNGYGGHIDSVPVGGTGYVWFDVSGYPSYHVFIIADSNQDIRESNETNNWYDQILPVPTLPLHCINSPTPTSTTMAGAFSERK